MEAYRRSKVKKSGIRRRPPQTFSPADVAAKKMAPALLDFLNPESLL